MSKILSEHIWRESFTPMFAVFAGRKNSSGHQVKSVILLISVSVLFPILIFLGHCISLYDLGSQKKLRSRMKTV